MSSTLKAPPSPVRRFALVMQVGGAVFFVFGIFPILRRGNTDSWPMCVMAALGIALGSWLLRIGEAGQFLGAAYDRITRGRLDEAEAILDTASTRNGQVLRAIANYRAKIALYRDDAKGAIQHASRAIGGPYAWLGRTEETSMELNARSIRAVAAAMCSEHAMVREDAQAVRMGPLASTEMLSRVTLAEVILLFRDGAYDEAAVLIDEKRKLLLDFATPRERAIVRAMQRAIAQREESPAANPLSSANPGKFEAIPGEARAAAERTVAKSFAQRWLRPLAFLVGIMGVYVGGQSAKPFRSFDLQLALLLLVIAIIVLGRMYRDRQSRQLTHATRAWVDGDLASSEASLRTMVKSPLALFAAQARLHLAQQAARCGQFEQAIDECDHGLSRSTDSATGRQILVPSLLGERATALAALGRHDEATATLQSIEKVNAAFHLMGSFQLGVRLLQAVRRGHLPLARELAMQRTHDLPLPITVETLADALVTTDDANPQSEEAARILHDLAIDRDLRRWLDRVWPDAESKLRAASLMKREGSP
ncbi:hypothetical protein LVJ94_34245 [Pendulispora rubella]|uniref:Uncharacterized protein n=1 Tax=Pendulispora rubella TaxID=2741070 RepID=A0ABZ2KWN3_9BACT